MMNVEPPTGDKADHKFFGRYHDLTLLLIGFVFTTVIGGSLGYYFQGKSWRYENNARRYEAEVTKASEIFDEISSLIDRRLYATRRLVWAYKDNDTEEIKKQREIYQQVVYDWNGNLNRNLSRTQRYFGDERRKELNDIRAGFREIDTVLRNYRKDSHPNQDELKRIEDMVDGFNGKIYGFNINLLTHIQEGRVGIFLSGPLPKR